MRKFAQYIGLLFILLSTVLLAETNPVQDNILAVMLSSFAAGLLLTFTPCVLPMVPILSSIVVGQGKKITKIKALTLSLSYVLGTAVTYALMGALAGATGEQLQSYFQKGLD
jgi:thiol:disulfide interchange protein DsbD